MASADILLVIAAATGATGGGLTLEVAHPPHRCSSTISPSLWMHVLMHVLMCLAQEKEMLKRWQKDYAERWNGPGGSSVFASQAILVCNKMNSIPVDAAPIPRHEAMELLVAHSELFQTKRMRNKSATDRMSWLEEEYGKTEDDEGAMSDAELCEMARKHKQPDDRPTRKKLKDDATQVFGESFVQQGGLHFVSANDALTQSQHRSPQSEGFQEMRRCLLDRIRKAQIEKPLRIAAAERRERERKADIARQDAERREHERKAQIAQKDAERRERERRAEIQRNSPLEVEISEAKLNGYDPKTVSCSPNSLCPPRRRRPRRAGTRQCLFSVRSPVCLSAI
eukprot:COSAG06_NODE_8651_length_2106_cov_1.233682_2_plen_339_part_00